MSARLLHLSGALAASLLLCSPGPREKTAKAPQSVPAAHERIWLAPLVNKSGINLMRFWPDDSLESAVLMNTFAEMEERLLSEFRRCEKFGLYEMVDDSGQATLRVVVNLSPCTVYRDTIAIPVRLDAFFTAGNRHLAFEFYSETGAPAVEADESDLHHAGAVLAEYGNSLPYRAMAALFYKKEKTR